MTCGGCWVRIRVWVRVDGGEGRVRVGEGV